MLYISVCGFGGVSFPSCTSGEQYATNRAHDDLYLKKMLAGVIEVYGIFSVFQSSGEREIYVYK